MRTKILLAAALALVAACGDDDGGGGGGGGGGAPPPPPPPAAASNPLVPRVHIEDRVPEPEKASIRHTFKERDFVPDTNRDPFQSYVVNLPGTPVANTEPSGPGSLGALCKADQLVATNYSYAELKLVGIVAQGTTRKVLMMDPGSFGRIIKRGDCVGKEKAVVKDIGTGYMTFVVMPESVPNGSARPSEEHSIQLHPNDLPLGDYNGPPREEPRPVAPVMPPTAPNGLQKPALPLPPPVPTPAGVPAAPGGPAAPAPAPVMPPAESPPVKT